MTDMELSRRRAMQATVGGLLGSGLLSGAASAGDDTSIESADGTTVYVGTGSALYGLDAETGETSVEASLDEITWSSPTVVDGVAYIGDNGDEDDDATLYALNAATGETEWAFTDPGDWVWSSPTVVDGTVYVGEGGAFETEDWDYSVFAIDAETGEEEWKFDVESTVESSPNVVDGTVYIGVTSTDYPYVYAIDAETGEEEWQFEAGHMHASPTAVDGTVYVGAWGSRGKVLAIDAETGDEEWSFDIEDNRVESSPTVVGGTVYIGDGNETFDEAGNLYALDAETGEEEWTYDEPEEALESSPTVYEGTVYVGSMGGVLYAVDAETGEEEWTFEADDEIEATPTAYDGTVYVGSQDSNLYAIDAETGEEEWSADPGISITSSPTVVDDPAEGDSVGSRVELGTLGHHHEWADHDPEDEPDDPPDEPAEGIVSAERDIDQTTVEAGESTEVTVTVELAAESDDLRITENFDPAFGDLEVIDDDGATVTSPTDDNDQIFGSWGGTDEVTLTYEVTIPEDAEDGEEFTIEGSVEDEDAGDETEPDGDTVIEVGEIDDPVAEYADDDGTVGPGGLGNAASDFRSGDLDPGTLGEVAAAFRSGTPVA